MRFCVEPNTVSLLYRSRLLRRARTRSLLFGSITAVVPLLLDYCRFPMIRLTASRITKALFSELSISGLFSALSDVYRIKGELSLPRELLLARRPSNTRQ